MPTRPPYVQSGPHEMPPPPYIHRNVHFLSFAMPGEVAAHDAICRKWFADPSQGQVVYDSVSQWTYLTMVDIQAVTSLDPEFERRGTMSERDIGFWFPAWRSKPFALMPRWLPVQLFVDKVEAAFAGREVYGFAKSLGRFSVPAPNSLTVETTVLKRFDPKEQVTWAPIIEFRPVGGSATAQEAAPGDGRLDIPRGPKLWSSAEEMSAALNAHLLGGARDRGRAALSGGGLSQGSVPGLATMAFLKQFLDVRPGGTACSQQIVEASAGVTSFRGAGRTRHKYEVRITSYPSHPFDSLLGISSSGWVGVDEGVWADIDFVMQEGDVIG